MTDREAFEAWYDAQPDGRIQPWDVWQAATAAKEAEIAAIKAERDEPNAEVSGPNGPHERTT